MASVLTLDRISKQYNRRILALDQVSFDVPEGCVFGILGPNGSGKTTMLGIVMNILRPTSGSFTLMGQPPTADVRKKVGTLLETPNFYHYLSAERNLRIAAAIKGVPETDEIIHPALQKVNLYERRDSKFSTFSLGMKQRLAIASALLGDPDVLVFDEPTNGLDPVGIAEIRELIIRLAQGGKTIIMASHMLDEVEKVCTHVAILQRGKLITSGAVDEVLVNEDIVELAASDLGRLEQLASRIPGVLKVKASADVVHASFALGSADMEGINRKCFEEGITLSLLRKRHKSLETKFLELTGANTPKN